MIIDECGRYRTLIEYKGGTSTSIWTIPEGTEFDVTQIDKSTRQFMSKTFGSWEYWDKRVEKIG